MRTSRRAPQADSRHWFRAAEGEVHKAVFEYVAAVERQQWDIFNRFLQLECLYDPNSPAMAGALLGLTDTPGLVIENVIASCVDTVVASIASSDVRPRFMTDDADWTVTKTARRLEWYAEGLGKLIDIDKACQLAFKSAVKKGTGIVKVFVNAFGDVKAEHVRIDDIVVDEAECRNGPPKQMHRRMSDVDRDELKAMFPDFEDEIDKAQTGRGWDRMWAGYRPVTNNAVVVIESHKLPIGKRGAKGYRPGRHTITIDSCDLLDEDYHKPHLPYAAVVWSEREAGFYGISLAEGIAGIQRALNKRNLQIDRNLDQYAFPTTYVTMADANLAVQTINRIGSVVVCRGERPTTVIPQAVSPEVYQNRADLKAAAFENSGVSRMASQAVKPAGIDSGVAMREYRDQTTQRFAMPEKAFEALVLQAYWLAIDCCKDLGDDAPVIAHRARFGSRKVKWADVDLGDVKVQIAAASTLSRTPAGRYQTALEWAQAGVISTDEWRELTQHPDLDRVLSLYTQGSESVDRDIEAIEEGEQVTPEPFGNLQLMVRKGQMAYLRDRDLENVPEEVLEGLRQYAVLAQHMLTPPAPANDMGAPGAAPPGPDAMAMPPPNAQPTAALSQQAMQLQAS